MSGVWLLLGPEEGEKKRFLDATIERTSKQGKGELEIHRVYPHDTPIVDMVAVLRNGSLFASHRVVVLQGVESVKSQPDVSLIVEYCEAPSPDATLFLLSTDLPNRIAARLIKAVSKEAQKIFWEMFENRKVDWIRGFFAKREIDITRQASQFIADTVAGNTRDMEQECGALAQFVLSQSERPASIELELVERYLYHSREENVFTLFDRMAKRDSAGAQEALEKILLSHQADPIQLLGGLLWQVRILHQVRALVEEGYPASEACSRLKVRGKRQQRIYTQAQTNFSLAETENMILLIADADRQIRTTRSELHRVILQLCLLSAVKVRSKAE